MRFVYFFIFLFGCSEALAQTRTSVGVTTNIRALAVSDSLHWWFGGSGGWLGHTADGGKSWELRQPAGSAVDFRSIHAFNQQEAVAAIAGQPAQIYRTQDGGKRWELVHWLKDTTAFIDAIGFWNAHDGLLFGDPLSDGKMLLLQTSDGGRSWEAMPDSSRPKFYPGEAAFAASGTAMHCVGDSTVVIVSGGSVSRFWFSHNRGRSWQVMVNEPMQAGLPSQGAFSVTHNQADSSWLVVGGDYLREQELSGNIGILKKNKWLSPKYPPRGYRECVVMLNAGAWIATGPAGSDVSWDAGNTWVPFNDENGMHVAKPIGFGGLLLAGKGGSLLRYTLLHKP